MASSKNNSSVLKTILLFIALLLLGFMLIISINYIRALFAPAAFPADGGNALNSTDQNTVLDTPALEERADSDEEVADPAETDLFVVPTATKPVVIEGEVETTYRYSADNSITLAPTDHAELMKHGMGATTDTTLLISGVEATQSTGYSVKDGSETVVLVIPVGEDGKQVLFVRGTDSFLTTVQEELLLNAQ